MSASASKGRIAIAVHGAGAPEDLLNEVLSAHGFAPVAMVASLADLTAQIRTKAPALVILPVAAGGAGSDFALFQAELRRHSKVAAIGTSPLKDADTVLASMRAGIHEFLVAPIDRGELEIAVTRLVAQSVTTSKLGHVFTVYSAKGGLGTSTLSLSLAFSIKSLPSHPSVALVDFSTTGVGVRVMLNMDPTYDLGSVSSRSDRLDREFLRSVLVKHEDGVHVLSAAEELDATDPLSVEASTRLLELLRQEFAYVVVDTDHHFADQTIAALDSADRILLLTHLDVSALRSTQRTLGVFNRLGYPDSKVTVVVNRKSDRDLFSVSDAERVIGRVIDFKLPNDYKACADAITYGRFVQVQSPDSTLVSATTALASSLTGAPADSPPVSNGKANGSRLSRLFGRS